MSRISTHVLDTASGKPALGIMVRLFRDDRELASGKTDVDGRCPNLLPVDSSIETAVYRLLFEVGAYFPEGFYPEVNIVFKAAEGTPHYHVPLLLSPFGYTTYRGS